MSSRESGESLTRPAVWTRNSELSTAAVETSEATSTEDPELKGRLQSAHSSDLDVLFYRYSRLVLATACRVLGDPGEAEEVVQDVFLYLHRKPELFNPSKGSLKAWIIQITVCRALDRKLHLARRGFYWSRELSSFELRAETDLEQQIEAKLSRRHLERALADLTHMQRRTIEFFYFEGLDLKEISKQLREPLGNIRHHYYRGLEQLRKSAVLRRLRCK